MNQKYKTPDWALSGNIYEVNTRQYTAEGTFAAFEKHLPRLKEMGVDILWFMPVTPISQLGRKGTLGSYYACSSYTKINPEFGNLTDFKQLVKHAHELGMKVLIDWVANHTGWDHEWIPHHPEYFKKNSEGNFYDAHGWEDVIDLDFEHKPLWGALVNAMQFWVSECDIDGFRCDMAHLIPIDFWDFARTTLDAQKPLLWVAETEDANYHQVFDASYGWELLHCMEGLYKKEHSVWQLGEVLHKYETNFPADALRLLFTSNHDENSHSGSEWERLGNGAKAFAILCATWKNALPLIYSGQELPNKKRLLFFDKDEIEWNGENLLASFYKILLGLRKNNHALQGGYGNASTRILPNTEAARVLAYARKYEQNEVFVILNLSHDEVKVTFPDFESSKHLKELFCGEQFLNNKIILEAWEFKVYAS